MYNILPCKGIVAADSEESYVDRFSEHSAIHSCNEDLRIPVDMCDYNVGRINNLLYQFRSAVIIDKKNSRPLRCSPATLRKLFVTELSYLRSAAIRYVFASHPTNNIIIILKNINLNISPLMNMPSLAKESISIDEYFHIYIDTQFLSLSIYHICAPGAFELSDILFDIMQNMIMLAYRTYEKYEHAVDIKNNTPFLCHCHRQLWLLLLKFYECCENVSDSFFDKLIVVLNTKRKSSKLFQLWLFRHLCDLELYDSFGSYNLNLCTSSTSGQLLKKQNEYLQYVFNNMASGNEEQLLAALRFTYLFMTDAWMRNTSIVTYKIIWEYIYKKMSSGPIEFTIPNTVDEILSLRQRIISSNSSTSADNELLVFMLILLKHLQKYPDDWRKLQSRFYTRFLPDRMSKLHISVNYAVVFVYLTLSEVDFIEISKKTVDILKTLPSRTNQHTTIWNLYVSLILLHIQKRQHFSECADTFMALVQSASADRKQYHLINAFVAHLGNIFDSMEKPNESDVLKLIQGNWIATYMASCSHHDFMNILHMLEKAVDIFADDAQIWPSLENTVRAHVVPQLELILSERLDTQPAIGVFASKIAKRSVNLKPSILEFYASDKCLNMNVSMAFKCDFLRSYPDDVDITLEQERVLMQAWVRCMLAGSDWTHMKETGFIFKLRSLAPLQPNILLRDKWQLVDLISAFRDRIDLYGCTAELRELAVHCFGTVDTAVCGALLSSPRTQEDANMRTLNALATIGALIRDCGQLLQPNKLNRLLAVTLLSHDVTLARSLTSGWLTAVQQVWSLYYNGLKSIMDKLAQHEQTCIDRMLRELIVRYVRYYPAAQSPIAHLLLNNTHTSHNDVEYVTCRISGELTRYNSNDERRRALLLIGYIYSHIHNKNDEQQVIVRSTIASVIDFIMTCDVSERTYAYDLLKQMKVHLINEHLELTSAALAATARTKMMFHGAQVLDLLKVLAPEIPNVVKAVLVDVERNIVDVEQRQGIRRNNMLRNLFEEVQSFLMLDE